MQILAKIIIIYYNSEFHSTKVKSDKTPKIELAKYIEHSLKSKNTQLAKSAVFLFKTLVTHAQFAEKYLNQNIARILDLVLENFVSEVYSENVSEVINSIGQILLSDSKYYQSLIQNDFLPKFIDAVGIIFIESLKTPSENSDFNLYQSISKFLSILSLYKPEKLLHLIKSLEKDIFKFCSKSFADNLKICSIFDLLSSVIQNYDDIIFNGISSLVEF